MEGFGDEEDAEVKHLSHHEIKGIKDDLRTLDMDEGISSYKGKHIKKNLETKKQVYLRIIAASLLASVYKIGNLLYILVLIVIILQDEVDQAYALFIPLILNFSIHGLKSFQLYRKKVEQDQSSLIQSQIIHKLVFEGNKSYFKDIKQDQLEIGDIILIKKDEICSTDNLIIACKEERCLVETTEIGGSVDYKLVTPVSSTNDENISIATILKSYKYTLTGKIEYYPLLKFQKQFQGYIKLENDPKGQKLSMDNIIQRGSYLRNTDWLLAIVIEYGFLNTVLSVKDVKIAKDKDIITFLNRFIQMSSIWISFAIFSVIFWKNIHSFSKKITPDNNQIQQLLESIVVYCQGVPVLLYAIVHLTYNVIKFQIERKYVSKSEDKKPEITINNPGAITNLSHIDIAVFSLCGSFVKSNSVQICFELNYSLNNLNNLSRRMQCKEFILETSFMHQSILKMHKIASGCQTSLRSQARKMNETGIDQESGAGNMQLNNSFYDQDRKDSFQNKISYGLHDEEGNNLDEQMMSKDKSFQQQMTMKSNMQTQKFSQPNDETGRKLKNNFKIGVNNSKRSIESEERNQLSSNDSVDCNIELEMDQHFPIKQQQNLWELKNKFNNITLPFYSSEINSPTHQNNLSLQTHNETLTSFFTPNPKNFFPQQNKQQQNNNLQTTKPEILINSDNIIQNNIQLSKELRSSSIKMEQNNDDINVDNKGKDKKIKKTLHKRVDPLSSNGTIKDYESQHALTVHPIQNSTSSFAQCINRNPSATLPNYKFSQSTNASISGPIQLAKQTSPLIFVKNTFSPKLKDQNNPSINNNNNKSSNNIGNPSQNGIFLSVLSTSPNGDISKGKPPIKEKKIVSNTNLTISNNNNLQIQKRFSNTLVTQNNFISPSMVSLPHGINSIHPPLNGQFYKWKELPINISFPKLPKFEEKLSMKDLFLKMANYNSTEQAEFLKTIDFFKTLALCHAVKTKRLPQNEKEEDNLIRHDPTLIVTSSNHNINNQKKDEEYDEEGDVGGGDNESTNRPNFYQYVYQSLSKDQEAQFFLCSKSGLEFYRGGFSKSKRFYDLKYKEKIFRYEIKQIFFPNQDQLLFGVIIKADEQQLNYLQNQGNNLSSFSNNNNFHFHANSNQKSSSTTHQNALHWFVQNESRENQLLVKGTAQQILPRCNLSKFQNDSILKDLQIQQSRGFRSLFFAKKVISSQNIGDNLNSLAQNLEYVGSIALLPQLIPDTEKIIPLFQSAGIINWLIASDSYDRVLSAAYQSKLIFHDTTLLALDQFNVEELKYQIKNHLFFVQNIILDEDEFSNPSETTNLTEGGNRVIVKSMRSLTKEQYKKRMSTKKGQISTFISDREKLKKVSLIIDGEILNIILSNEYLKSHFSFLCHACNSVLGYHFSSNSKALLISLVQKIGREKTTIISFGYGSKDNMMMNQSNFSFLIDGQNMCQRNIGDATIKDFSQVKRLIFQDSIEISDKLQYLVVTNTKLIIFILFLNYFYQLHNYQIRSGLVSGYQILVNIYLSQTVGSIYIVLSSFKNNAQNSLIYLKPEFYRFRKTQNSWMRSHFIDCLLFSTIHAFLASFMLENPLMGFDSTDGKLVDYENVQGVMSLVMGIVLIVIVMAGPMSHKLLNSLIFIVVQTSISLIPSLFKVVFNVDKFKQPYIFERLFTLWEAFSIIFIMVPIFIMEYFYNQYFRLFLIPKPFREVFALYDIKFMEQNLRSFQDKLKIIVNDVRIYSEQLSEIIKSIFIKTEIDPFLRKILDPAQKMEGNQDIHSQTLEFKDKRVESNYKQHRLDYICQRFMPSVLVIIGTSIIQTILYFLDNLNQDLNESELIIYSLLIYSRFIVQCTIEVVVIVMLIKDKEFMITYGGTIIQVVYYFALPFIIINSTLYTFVLDTNFDILTDILVISLFNWESVPPPMSINYFMCTINAIGAINKIFKTKQFDINENSSIQNQIICMIAFVLLVINNITFYFSHEKGRRNNFSTKNRIKYEESTVDHVLANLLPSFVRSRFNSSGNASIEEDQGNVAILFLDICDFDDILNSEYSKLIKWIDNLYRLFDKICMEYGIQKIETVGKIYMACAGLKLTKEERLRQQKMLGDNETKRLLLAAQEMQIKAKGYLWGINKLTQVKIGIHYGKVIAGVIGAHKPQFSLIGDTVNTASRVCSNCKKGKITLSSEAHSRIGKTDWLFIEREVEAKGKGIIKMYSLAENIGNNLIKIKTTHTNSSNHSPLEQQRQVSMNFKPLSRREIKDAYRNSPTLSQRCLNATNSLHDTGQSEFSIPRRISIDNGEMMANVNQYSPLQIKSNKTKSNNKRNYDRKNKTQVASQFQNDLTESPKEENKDLAANNQIENNNQEDVNSFDKSIMIQKGGTTLNESKQQNSFSSMLSSQVKRKKRSSQTMVFQPRNSLNSLGPKVLESLEIKEEEVKPEKEVYQGERPTGQRSQKRDRQQTIVFTNDKNLLNKDQNQQEPMLKVSRFLLSYEKGSEEIRQRFELTNCIESSQWIPLRGQILLVLLHSLLLITVFLNLNLLSVNSQILSLILKAAQIGMTIIFFIILPKLTHKILLYNVVTQAYYFISHIIIIIMGFIFIDNFGILNIIFVEHVCVLNSAQSLSALQFKKTFHFSAIVVGFWIFVLYQVSKTQYIANIICIVIFEIYRCYVRWDAKIENFNNLVAHEIKKLEKDNLLKYLVPKHILTQFLQNKRQYQEISETLEKVTLLFADIAGFTSYSSNKQPSEVVKMLRNLFTSFDQLCLKHKVYKVYTIGDCYVVLGIVDKYNRSYPEECANVVKMGFSMIQVIEEIKQKHSDFAMVNMRIGIHLGESILGGIIGTNIVRYDIFGKDVLIANKMESNGQNGKVNVSDDTRKFLESHYPKEFNFDFNKEVELNNFQTDGNNLKIKTYFIEKNEEFSNNIEKDVSDEQI